MPNIPPSQPGFWALIATQFQGAFSDNALRYLLLGLVVGPGLSERNGNRLVSVVMLLFSVPFILFSMSGGYLADRFSKRNVTICTKLMEIGSMLIATAGLALHSLPIEFNSGDRHLVPVRLHKKTMQDQLSGMFYYSAMRIWRSIGATHG